MRCWRRSSSGGGMGLNLGATGGLGGMDLNLDSTVAWRAAEAGVKPRMDWADERAVKSSARDVTQNATLDIVMVSDLDFEWNDTTGARALEFREGLTRPY